MALDKNSRLNAMTEGARVQVAACFQQTQTTSHAFMDLRYGPRTWKTERLVIACLERGDKRDIPRYLVTNLQGAPAELYERLCCASGQMENRIEEAQLGPFADCSNGQHFVANRFRLLPSNPAHL